MYYSPGIFCVRKINSNLSCVAKRKEVQDLRLVIPAVFSCFFSSIQIIAARHIHKNIESTELCIVQVPLLFEGAMKHFWT